MQKVANNNLVLKDFISFKQSAGLKSQASHSRLYQQLVSGLIKDNHSKHFFAGLGDRLVSLADHLYGLRQIPALEQVGQMLLSLPLAREYRIAGQHYQALCAYKMGRSAEARTMLDRVAEEAPLRYKARAFLSISATIYPAGDLQSILSLNVEASRMAGYKEGFDSRTVVESQRNIAIVKSILGDHPGALADLERLYPLVRSIGRWHPDLFYDYLNSFAVELGEVGRLGEARRASEIALASAYAHAYPEWRETRDDITRKSRRASRSLVAISRKRFEAQNVLRLSPESSYGAAPANPVIRRTQEQARVFSLLDWKYKTTAKTAAEAERPISKLNGREMLLRIMDLVSDRDLTEDQLARILEAIEKIASEPKGRIS